MAEVCGVLATFQRGITLESKKDRRTLATECSVTLFLFESEALWFIPYIL